MKQALESPWLTVSLTIVVMTIGYIMLLDKEGNTASAGRYSCPASACASEECLGEECSSTSKCKHCPGCSKES